MNRPGRIAWLLAGLMLAILATSAEDTVTLEGEFVWQRTDGEKRGDVQAVFTPTGEAAWDVAFHFEWEDGPHVYRGTAEGDMTGALGGAVEHDDPENKATFRFQGTFDDGKFSGTHGQVLEDGTLRDTGTITLAPAAP